MRGDTTETSNLDRILQQIQIQNSNPSSFPPSDMSTRTDIGLLQPQKPKKFVPWFSDLPVWETTLPGTPKQASYHLSELAKDITPVEGQRRSAIRSAQETAKAKGLLEQGKYLEALPHGIWAGVESLDVALSALPVAGAALAAPLDLARRFKNLKPVRPVPKKVYGGEGAYLGPDKKELTGSFTEGRVNVEDGIKFGVGTPTASILDDRSAGNKVKVNLFKQKAGWKWVGKPPVETPTIISVEQGNKHYYTLDSDIGNVDLAKYPNQPSEPRLRPSSRGDLKFGEEVGKINLRGKLHPVYDTIEVVPRKSVDQITPPKQQAIINFGIRNQPTLRKAINQARKENHLIKDLSKGQDGQFVGAPRGIKSKTEINKMRKEFDAQVAGGVLGADWYNRVRTFTRGIAGGSRKAESQFSDALALWSAQANPETNLNWAIQAKNNWEAGRGLNFPEKIKTKQQSKTFLEGMLSDSPVRLGKKTGVYKQSLDPNVETPITGTNDIWHGRAFGYKNNDGTPFSRGFTPQEHVFLDNETVLAVDRANQAKLGGRSNWTAAEIQAAAWVFAKGKSEFAKRPKYFEGNFDNAIEWARKTYPEYLDKHLAFGTREDIPGVGTGHLQGVTDADYLTKAEYAGDVPGNLGTETDVITEAAGLLSPGLRPATGVFKSQATGQIEVNPAQANQVLVDLVNDEGGKTISGVSQSFLNAIEGVHGYINMQNGSAWHKFIPFQTGSGAKSSASNAIMIKTGAPLDEARMRDLAEWANERGMILSDNGKSVVLWPDEWGSKPALSSAGEEVIPEGGFPDGAKMRRLLDGKKATKKREAVSGWKEDLGKILQVDEGEVKRGRVVSGYVDYEDVGEFKLSNSAPENAGRALRTKTVLDLLDDPNIPAMLDNLDNSQDFKQLVLDHISRATDWSKKLNTPLREDHMNALKILSEKGFKGLREAMKNGAVLPAVALPIFGAGFQVQQEQGT